jgi:hypothetical protein
MWNIGSVAGLAAFGSDRLPRAKAATEGCHMAEIKKRE